MELTPEQTSRAPAAIARMSDKSGGATVTLGDALELYHEWPAPVAIVVDGPYGVSGYPGDPPDHRTLASWYRPHAQAWFEHATPLTTLWFWCTEIGWAASHQAIEEAGWEYVGCNIWDKGIAHVAGNCNTKTLRKFPVVTEVCAQYVKPATFDVNSRRLSMKEWLRWEWLRTGLPLYRTNEAAGVKNAATRKWFTQCHLWYFPPPEAMQRIVGYANEHGKPFGRPYFSLDGKRSVTADEWSRMRSRFDLQALGEWQRGQGLTNVWQEPALRNSERIRLDRSLGHPNQKPLELISRLIRVSTSPGEVVWEPFGGLCTTAVAAAKLARRCFSAEILPGYYDVACKRLKST